MPTYQEYQEQIAKLQALAEQARQDELVEARRKVRELMDAHKLSPLDFAESNKKTKSAEKKGTVQAKYRDPDSGATWTGRGRAPRWLSGRNKEEFLIK
ncbi:H-NS histone family protein [Massilia alkalitolerans]|uniref:H-NS histone family protein n=1 Tax=Massilia alkalitolerans TaxID=286638 RepID=UPI000A00C47B|nr:H-NS histone family protein [Massilia alkalitolerans]